MFHRRGYIRMLAAVALLSLALETGAKEVKVLSFSFEMPDSWSVEGSGGDTLFSTGATEAYAPPFVLAAGCVPTAEKDCSGFKRPDPSKELQSGCSDAIDTRIPRADRIVETRWVCSPVTVGSTRVTIGTSMFEVDGAILVVTYGASEQDLSVSAFLDTISGSMKARV